MAQESFKVLIAFDADDPGGLVRIRARSEETGDRIVELDDVPFPEAMADLQQKLRQAIWEPRV